ncbi:RICIN domain-containing protein [Streptomyces sp. NPDC059929]|uniref:RICIN domain-containing protein n=1 Tax=Streptomyces sp. NPDC059929 TaxID=3347008 RepID=UPI003665FA57
MLETITHSGDLRSRARAKTAIYIRIKSGLLVIGFLVSIALGTTQTSGATALVPTQAPHPDTCVQNTAWRLTTPDDHVCVPQISRDYIYFQNLAGPGLRDPSTGQCKSGYVPRAAVPGDNVCVAPWQRDYARSDTERAPMNWAATFDRNIWGNYVPHPFAFPNSNYLIMSSDTRESNGQHVLVADVFGGRTEDGIKLITWVRTGGLNQEFQFRRDGNGLAFQNLFEIVAKHTGKCLDVYGFSPDNGAGIMQRSCDGSATQKWYLERRADNEWQIRNLFSRKCLDAANPALTAPAQGVKLQQWTCIGGKNQAWRLLMTS